jgi:flavin-dependent dehydrogenase
MTDVKAVVEELAPSGLASKSGLKIGFLDSAAKAAQNDTVTITNAKEVVYADLTIDADGTEESVTISGNTITLRDSTTGAVSGLVVYK